VGSIATDLDSGLQSLTLMVGPGLGVNWTLSLVINGLPANATTQEQREALLFSYQPPVLTSMSRDTGSTQGGYNVTLTGQNFGNAAFFAAAGRCVALVFSCGCGREVGWGKGCLLHTFQRCLGVLFAVCVNVNDLRLGFSNTTRNPEGLLSHNIRKFVMCAFG
jgi:hypothetical protein